MEDDIKTLVSDEIKRFRESYKVGWYSPSLSVGRHIATPVFNNQTLPAPLELEHQFFRPSSVKKAEKIPMIN